MKESYNSIRQLALLPSHLENFLEKEANSTTKYKESLKCVQISDISFVEPWWGDVPINSVAFYQIQGYISYNSWWRFSTSDFIAELKEADANPNIVAHLIYVDSPGGEIFGLHEANETLRSLTKPSIGVISRMGCSAAVWLVSGADKVYMISPLSEIGSIGVMASFVDDSEYLKNQGIKYIEVYASDSVDKNKIARDVIAGNDNEYVEKMLDPVMLQFKEDILKSRPSISQDALSGKVYYANEAQSLGLVDGIKSLEDAALELYHSSQLTDQMISDIQQFL